MLRRIPMNISIGENIRAMRRRCGFTQEELAAQLAVTPQAVSKWENGNGMPDITQIVPLAQIFGITTDTLLGVVSAKYGDVHTEAAKSHVRMLMATSQSSAEKNLAAYTYMRAESEKEPANYTIMRLCINYAAEISRYADFEGFMADRPDIRDEIFADCERKNICISRYCEDRANVESSDYAMAWIYIHTKRYDKAKAVIGRLPGLESSFMREHMETKLTMFQYGYDKARELIPDNIRKLLGVSITELANDFENVAWFGESGEAIELGTKISGILDAYKTFAELKDEAILGELRIRRYLPRCYAAAGDMEKAENEFVTIAERLAETVKTDVFEKNCEDTAAEAEQLLSTALESVDESKREALRISDGYKKAADILRTALEKLA